MDTWPAHYQRWLNTRTAAECLYNTGTKYFSVDLKIPQFSLISSSGFFCPRFNGGVWYSLLHLVKSCVLWTRRSAKLALQEFKNSVVDCPSWRVVLFGNVDSATDLTKHWPKEKCKRLLLWKDGEFDLETRNIQNYWKWHRICKPTYWH